MTPSDAPSLSRRDALKILGSAVAATGLGLKSAAAAEAAPAPLGWELPALSFAYGALEPHIDARTMEIHHTKHHQAYLTNAKNLLKDHPDLLARGPEALVRDLAGVPEAIRPGIRNNVGGHVNHAFFWRVIAPGGAAVSAPLDAALTAAFGSMDGFKRQFTDAALKRFGSGWAWLVVSDSKNYTGIGSLRIVTTANQDSPLTINSPLDEPVTPIIGLDVWEHAYYLHYQNRRADYVSAFWNVLNWTQAGANYAAALKG